MTTRDVDKGRRRLRRLMRQLDAGEVVVGALDEENAAKLAFAEFGTATAPPRPVVRQTLDANARRYGDMMEREVLAGIDGKKSAPNVLDAVGRAFMKDLRQAILDFSTPGNAPSTIAAKGKDDPLVDSGELVRGIVYKVKR